MARRGAIESSVSSKNAGRFTPEIAKCNIANTKLLANRRGHGSSFEQLGDLRARQRDAGRRLRIGDVVPQTTQCGCALVRTLFRWLDRRSLYRNIPAGTAAGQSICAVLHAHDYLGREAPDAFTKLLAPLPPASPATARGMMGYILPHSKVNRCLEAACLCPIGSALAPRLLTVAKRPLRPARTDQPAIAVRW